MDNMQNFLIITLFLIGSLGLIFLTWGLIEASCLKVTHDKFIIKQNGDSSPDLRILYFSDLHRENCLVSAKRVLRVIKEENSKAGLDAVIFGGDIADRAVNAHKSLDYINSIADLCRELHIPFMAVTGNHDSNVEPDELGAFKFDLMDGCIKYLKSGRTGEYIAFAGVHDSGRHGRYWDSPPNPSAGIPYSSYILLSHNPDIVLHMRPDMPFKVDGVISGHIHGGQIKTPIGLEFMVRKDALPKKGIVSGIHEVNGMKLFISKGIGCVVVPIRFLVRPEINILDIYC